MISLALLLLAAVLYFPRLLAVGTIGLLGVPGVFVVLIVSCALLYRPGPRKR